MEDINELKTRLDKAKLVFADQKKQIENLNKKINELEITNTKLVENNNNDIDKLSKYENIINELTLENNTLKAELEGFKKNIINFDKYENNYEVKNINQNIKTTKEYPGMHDMGLNI